jgi:aminopeptidase N
VDGRTLVTLRQERFSLGSASLPPQTWRIPIQLSRGNTRATLLLEEPEQTFPLPGCTREPVIANGGGIGYYRVEYGATDIERLAKAFARLRQADRVTLLGDTFALAQAGRAPMASYFSLLAALPTVRDGSRGKLHSMAFLALGFLDDAMAGTPAQARVRSAARALLAPALADLGWEPKPGEAAEDVRLRGSLIRMLARFDDASVAERSRQLFDEDVAGKRPLPTSTRSAVIHAVGIHADQARFDRLVALLKSAQGEEDRRMYARALAAGRDPGHARELLVVSLSGDLPPNVASSLAGWMGETSPNAPLAYEFTLERFGDLARLSGTNLGESAWLLPSAAWSLNEVSWAQRLVEDQQAKAGPDGAAAAQEAAARIKLLAFVRERDAAALAEFLAGWSPRS